MNRTAAPPIFRYHPENTLIHAIPAGIKFISLSLLTLPIFSPSLVLLALASITVIFAAVLARVSVPCLLRNARILASYAVFLLFFRLAGRMPEPKTVLEALTSTGFYIWQLSAVILAGSVFYETTGSTEIRHFLTAIQRRLTLILKTLTRRDIALPDIALHLSLTISFIPRIFDSWNMLNLAWDARGGRMKRGIRSAWKRMTVLVPLLVISLLSVASDTGRAIQNRSA